VVDQVERGELTYLQAQERYGIQGASTVLVWLRKHGRQDWKAASSGGKGPQKMSETPKQLTPEQRIKELEVQLKEAQEKAQFFEAVVTVLKRDYGVKVAKKPVGKFSRKSSSKG
jgi:transposase